MLEPIPNLTRALNGLDERGAYPTSIDLTVVAHADTAANTVTITVSVDGANDALYSLTLTPHEAAAAAQALAATHPAPVEAIPELTFEPSWHIHTPWVFADLADIADELTAWLRYATGVDEWDGSDTWEF